MNNPASFLILLFLAVTFLQSGYDKLFYWNDNLNWLKQHFSKTVLKNIVPFALGKILVLELTTGVLAIIGMFQLLINGGRTYGLYAAILACVTLIMLLLGQRIAKDYDGARTIAIYFVPAVFAVLLLS